MSSTSTNSSSAEDVGAGSNPGLEIQGDEDSGMAAELSGPEIVERTMALEDDMVLDAQQLQQHEDVKGTLAALRQEYYYANHRKPTLEDLAHGVIMDQLFSFLDARSLFKLGCLTAKSLQQYITLKHVIWSAVSSGGNARVSLDRVVALVRKKQIYTPSKMRLLRIMNGCRCERGDKCVQYAYLQKAKEEAEEEEGRKKSALDKGDDYEPLPKFKRQVERDKREFRNLDKPRGAKLARKDFGLFICADCTEVWKKDRIPESSTLTHATEKLTRYGNDFFLNHPRLTRRDQNNTFRPIVMREPFVDASGERAGPVLTHQDCTNAWDYVNDQGERDKDGYIKKRLAEVDEIDAEARKIADNILLYHKQATEQYQKRATAEKNQTEERRLAVYTKRAKQFNDGVLMVMKRRFEGCAWKDIALEHTAHPKPKAYVRTEPVVKFKCPFVQTILGGLLVAPRLGDKETVIMKANEIAGVFNLMWNKGFYDFSFLHAKKDRLSADLRLFYTSQRLSPTQLLHHRRMHIEVIQLIQRGQLLEALYRRFQYDDCLYLVPEEQPSSVKKRKAAAAKSLAPPPPVWFTNYWKNWLTHHHTREFFPHAALEQNSSELGHVDLHSAREIALHARKTNQPNFGNRTGKGFAVCWRNNHTKSMRCFDNMLKVAREYCDDIMAGSYGEQPGDSAARRHRRKIIYCWAIRRPHMLDGKHSFADLRKSVRYEMTHYLDVHGHH